LEARLLYDSPNHIIKGKKGMDTVNPPIPGLQTPADQNKVYQSAIHRVDLDIPKIAMACYLAEEVVQSAIKVLFKAVADVCFKAHDLELNMGIAWIKIINKKLSCHFLPPIVAKINTPEFEREIVESRFKVSSFYRGG
jgi:hypothetical protein